MIKTLYRLAILVVFLGMAAIGGYVWFDHEIYGPGPSSEETTVLVVRGDGVRQIGEKLEAAGVIRDARLFLAATKLSGDAPLRAGEFSFPAEASLTETLRILRFGRPIQHKFTVVEGQTVRQVLGALANEEKLAGEIGAVPGEGTLLPQTYLFDLGDQRQELLGRIVVAMDQALDREWAARASGLAVSTPREALILASIIEKETGLSAERERISAVFHNRLKLGMKLQSDPTTIYAVSEGLGVMDRPLSRADLAREHPINTYHAFGLPPQPICNPGEESLRAALHPADSEELYFVADGKGGHRFAKTLAEHNRNVAAFRRQGGG